MEKILSPAGWMACFVLCLVGVSSLAQEAPPVNEMRRVIAAVDSFAGKMPREQLYLHFDKPYYAAGDTLWFKAYLVDASRASSTLSSILYVELFNDSNTVVKRLALPIILGTARGDILLDETALPQGVYGIRAYTNWMRNFGENYFFYKYFYIGHVAGNSLLVDEQHKVSGEGNGSMARLTLRLTDLEKQAVRNREFQVSVLEKKKSLFRERLTTSAQGILQVDCELPGKAGARYIVVTLEDRGRSGDDKTGDAGGAGKTIVPIYLDRPESTSLQFMPEGGSLVAGLPAHIGFRAMGEDGKGVDLKGFITDSHGKRIVSFSSLHRGIGSFDLLPQAGEAYTAHVSFGDGDGRGGFAGGEPRTYPLPVVAGSGTALKVEDRSDPDMLALGVYFSPDRVDGVHKYLLIGQARETVVYGATVVAGKDKYLIRIPCTAFPTGVLRFSLLDENRRPLNERFIYIDRHDPLRIAVTADTVWYGVRDSIALHLSVTDAGGKPVVGSFSLAVTDETQVKGDSLQNDNILTRLLLSADLKGEVEDPAFYFRDQDSMTLRALDNLLLTREELGYDWKQVLGGPPSPAYLPQREFTVRGKATNVFNKGIKQTHVLLLSSGRGQQEILKDTVTNDQGNFVFDRFPPFDTATFFIQAKNRRGKDFNVGIEIDDPPPPVLEASPPFPVRPWYVNGDNNLIQYMTLNAAYRQEQESLSYPGKGKALPVFTVRGKKGVPDSKNLNGPGNADQVIDEDQLQKDGKKNLLQVLEKEVVGFHEGFARRSTQMTFLLHEKRIRFIFDGVNLAFAMPGADHITIRDYLESYSAEDLKGIEVMYNPGHSSAYNFRYSSTASLMSLNDNIAYLEITTRSGRGPYQRHTPGTWLYKPQPFYFGRQFYRPRYALGAGGAAGTTGARGATGGGGSTGKNDAGLTDLRSTIHWSSDILTDTTGHATVSFFAADRPGSYHIIVEGSDMNGLMGYGEGRIEIRKP